MTLSFPLETSPAAGCSGGSRRGRLNAAMKIRVAHGARQHEVTISGSATVAELKDKLQPLTGVPPELQALTVLSRHQPEPQIQPRP